MMTSEIGVLTLIDILDLVCSRIRIAAAQCLVRGYR